MEKDKNTSLASRAALGAAGAATSNSMIFEVSRFGGAATPLKSFGWQDSRWARFVKWPRWLTQGVLVGACLWLVAGCASVRYRPPACDLNLVLAVRLPEYINTLAAIPRSETIVENGISKYTSERSSIIKEAFDLRKNDNEYQFTLFLNEEAAIKWYEFDKNSSWAKKHYPVFRESTVDGKSGYVCYTVRYRGEWFQLSNDHISQAYFRLHNMVIRVTTNDYKSRSDKFTNAIKDLAQILDAAFNPPHD